MVVAVVVVVVCLEVLAEHLLDLPLPLYNNYHLVAHIEKEHSCRHHLHILVVDSHIHRLEGIDCIALEGGAVAVVVDMDVDCCNLVEVVDNLLDHMPLLLLLYVSKYGKNRLRVYSLMIRPLLFCNRIE